MKIEELKRLCEEAKADNTNRIRWDGTKPTGKKWVKDTAPLREHLIAAALLKALECIERCQEESSANPIPPLDHLRAFDAAIAAIGEELRRLAREIEEA